MSKILLIFAFFIISTQCFSQTQVSVQKEQKFHSIIDKRMTRKHAWNNKKTTTYWKQITPIDTIRNKGNGAYTYFIDIVAISGKDTARGEMVINVVNKDGEHRITHSQHTHVFHGEGALYGSSIGVEQMGRYVVVLVKGGTEITKWTEAKSIL